MTLRFTSPGSRKTVFEWGQPVTRGGCISRTLWSILKTKVEGNLDGILIRMVICCPPQHALCRQLPVQGKTWLQWTQSRRFQVPNKIQQSRDGLAGCNACQYVRAFADAGFARTPDSQSALVWGRGSLISAREFGPVRLIFMSGGQRM